MATHTHEHDKTTINDLLGARLTGLISKAPIFAAVGIVLCLAGIFLSPSTFFQSYLFAFMFWFGITLGSTAWLMGHHITGGGWGFMLRRMLEASTRCWPWVFGMWIPILIAMFLSMPNGHPPSLYEWADLKITTVDPVLNKKIGYLNPIAWTIRALIYFVIWFGLAHFLNKWSREEDTTNDPRIRHKLNLLSAAGLILVMLTITFSTIDWVMTLEPHWFSSLWGVIFLVGQGQSTLAIMILIIRRMGKDIPLVQRIETRYLRDIGNLLLAFTLLWAYTNYSQFMIQYSGNIAEEAEWFVHRTTFGWQYFGAINIILHFALPFVFLLMSITKVNLNNLAKLAGLLLFARLVDLFFYVVPTFRQSPLDGFPGGEFPLAFLADFGAPLALGGIWLWVWANQLKKANAPIVPVYDERLTGYWPLPEVHDAHGNENVKGVTAHG